MIARGMKTSVGLSLSLGRFPFAGRQSNTPTQRVLPPIGVILWAVDRCWLTVRKADVHPSASQQRAAFCSWTGTFKPASLEMTFCATAKYSVINLKPNVYRWLIESTGQTRGGGDAS